MNNVFSDNMNNYQNNTNDYNIHNGVNHMDNNMDLNRSFR